MVVRPVVCRRFVGRSEELAFLRERRLLAAKSHGGAVLIAGDAGVGKSRLIAEFCAGLAGSRWRVAWGANLEHAQRPYGPVYDVLAALDDTGEHSLVATATKREHFDAIAERFERAAAKTAIVAVIEDLHWADTATLELLGFLIPKLERLRVLLLASFRPRAVVPGQPGYDALAAIGRVARSGRIDLAPFDERLLRAFIDETLVGHTLGDEARRVVARTSEGNAFFAEELLKSAVQRRALHASDTSDDLPSSLRATLLEHWHLLSEPDRRIIAHAAVIGRTFRLQLLAQTAQCDLEPVLDALSRARDAQLIEELTPTKFRFRHALTREAIYAGFLGAQVRPLHRRIAIVLEADPPETQSLEGLAYHWWAAGDGERAAHFNVLAGDAAARVHAHDDAIAFFQRALASPALDARARATTLEKIADRCVALSFTDRAHEQYADAASFFASAGDDDGEARCRVRAAITAYATGRSEPTAELEAMLRRLSADAFLARSRVHLGVAWLTATFWSPMRAAHHLAQVDPRALADREIALRFHNVSAWVAMTMGDLAAFRREHAAWIAAAEAAGSFGTVAAAHYNGAWCYTLFGLHEEAAAQTALAHARADEERSQHGRESAFSIAALCALHSGDLARARAALDAVPPTSDNVVTMAHAVACGTLLGAYTDDDDLMNTWFDAAGNAMLAKPDGACGAGLAEVLIRRGRLDEARGVLARAVGTSERPRGDVLTQLYAARYADHAVVERAREQLVCASSAAMEVVEGPTLALFDAYVALREGRREEAAASAREAVGGFARLGFPLLEAAARELAGDHETALALYRRCGATASVRRLLALRPPEDARAAAADDARPRTVLSAREMEIAALVVRGKSNVEIARALGVSHKTVEKHLGSVYGKLDITSRAQLAAHVAAGGATAGAV